MEKVNDTPGTKALVALLAEQRNDDLRKSRSDEVLLADAGFLAEDIATMLGKNKPAVIKAIQRGRAKR